jgi:hypothetical protein
MLLSLYPKEYASYYDGPVILCFLILLSLLFRALRGAPTVASWAEPFVCFACAGTALLLASHLGREIVPLQMDYGMIRVPKASFRGYASAVAFLSGTECPNRVYQLVPGVIAPGRMTEELINELERKKPRYLLWSNRKYTARMTLASAGKRASRNRRSRSTLAYLRFGSMLLFSRKYQGRGNDNRNAKKAVAGEGLELQKLVLKLAPRRVEFG